MVQHLTRLIKYSDLLWLLTLRELKARHRQTLLGMGWALVQPVSMMLVFTAVFSVFVKVPVERTQYAAFAYIGLVSWLFFANSLSTGITSLVVNMNLITKASFPREVIPLSSILTASFDFLIGLSILGILLFVSESPLTLALLMVPGIVMIQVVFTAGLVLLGSALNVLKRDVGSLLPLVLQIWMFMSPIVYPVSVVPDSYRVVYMLNPMAMIVEAYRSAILMGTMPPFRIVVPVSIIACVSLFVGYTYFKSVELKFADVM